jgi:hypothetical protein
VNADFRFQRAVDRTFVGDFQEPFALLRGEIAFECDHPVDVVDFAFFGFAIRAILGLDLFVAESDYRP